MDRVDKWYRTIEDTGLDIGDGERTAIEARMLENLRHAMISEKPGAEEGKLRVLRSVFKVAAAVSVLAICGWWVLARSEFGMGKFAEGASARRGFTSYVNESSAGQTFVLPDGSTVLLETSGRIQFRKNFLSGNREVYLSGKGFFNVVKDPSKPFYVYSGKVAIRVLGTSFFVDASSFDKKVSVKVLTGEVSVFEIKEKAVEQNDKLRGASSNGVVLTPNQKVEYYVDGGHWVTGLVEEPVPVKHLDERTLSFVYTDTPVRDVLLDIHERYGIEVVTENDKIANCAFTGDVSRMPLYDLLDVVCTAIGSTYEVKGTRILISGNGCQ